MKNKKKLFRVPVEMTTYLYVDVMASDIDEAFDIADETDGGDFIDIEDCSWTINADRIEEIEEDK